MNSIPSEQASTGSPEKKSASDEAMRLVRNAMFVFGAVGLLNVETALASNNEVAALLAYISNLESRLAEQREDAKRLDWLDTTKSAVVGEAPDGSEMKVADSWGVYGWDNVRDAIDRARRVL